MNEEKQKSTNAPITVIECIKVEFAYQTPASSGTESSYLASLLAYTSFGLFSCMDRAFHDRVLNVNPEDAFSPSSKYQHLASDHRSAHFGQRGIIPHQAPGNDCPQVSGYCH